MDIKAALNSIMPISVRSKDPTSKAIKSGNTTDRDANGQSGYQQQKQQHPPMSEEQFKKALEHIAEIPAVKEHSLVAEPIEQDGKRFVLLKEPSGKIIRRIPEVELWSLPVFKENEPHGKGQLLSKTA